MVEQWVDMVSPIPTHLRDVYLQITLLPIMVERYVIRKICNPMSLKRLHLPETPQVVVEQYMLIMLSITTDSIMLHLLTIVQL